MNNECASLWFNDNEVVHDFQLQDVPGIDREFLLGARVSVAAPLNPLP